VAVSEMNGQPWTSAAELNILGTTGTPPSVTLSATPASIAAGQSSTLTWSATNATSCSAAAAWTTSTATSGSQTVKPTSTTTYTMTCTGAGGTTSASTTVTVTTKPSVTLSATPASIAAGQSSSLKWTGTNVTSCAANWTTSTATSGSQTVKPTSTTTYTMTCTGAGGSASASTTVTVTVPPKPSVTLSAAPASIAAGQSSTLTWSATNATSCSAPWITSTATSGSQSVKPTSTTPYTMTCTGAGGTASASTTVTVNTPVGILIPQQQFHVVSVDSQELAGENGAATNAIDGNPATIWHTEWSQSTAPLPHTLVLDLGAAYQVDGFRYLPRQDGTPNGTIAGYQFFVSPDGTTWGTAVAAGTLAADTTEKTVRFTAKTGRYVRLVAVSEMNGQPWTSAAELNVFGSVTQPTGSAPTAAVSATPSSDPAPVAKSVTAVSATSTNGSAPLAVTSTETAPPLPKPVAAFSATSTNGRLPLKVAFTDASTGSITVAPALLEVGDLTVDYVWKRITFRQVFVDPIVVATPLSSNDFAPATIRIRNVEPTGFEIRVQEWDDPDGVHLPETVSYLAMERGAHTLGTGIRVEAGRMTTNQVTSWSTVSFQQGFQVAPVLLTAVTSFNEADAVITRVDGVSAGGFQIRLQEQTSNAPSHAMENIDYIAWEPSAGTVDGLRFEVKNTANVVTDQVYTLQFTEPFLTPPMFLAGMQTTHWTDPATLRWDYKDQSQVVIQLQEEVSTAPNLTHPAEVVGYMAFTYP
jgi:F5/8 type C domain